MSEGHELDLPNLPLPRPLRERLPDLTGDVRQLASVRGIVLDDGPERGCRALSFSTGGGLDFWVLSDRTMDIGPLWFRGLPVAWHHPSGFVAPALHDPRADGDTGLERALSGFLVTCGLDNVRQPQAGLPLHGTLPFTPARVTARGEDWDAPVPHLYAEGEAVAAHLGRSSFRLTRRIEAPIGGRSVAVFDTIENIGPSPAEMRILYHMNFGFPAVGAGTRLELDGRTPLGPHALREGEPLVVCRRSAESDRFRARLVRPASGDWRGLAVSVEGPVRALPFVQFWSDPRPRRNILAIEPANCDRRDDGTSGEGGILAPGERWTADLRIALSDGAT